MAGTGRQHRHPSARAGRSDAPETNPAVGAAIMEVVDNQLRDGTPPETRQTFDRLLVLQRRILPIATKGRFCARC